MNGPDKQPQPEPLPLPPGRARIVIAEDRPEVLRLYERLLKLDRERWHQVFVHNADEAFAALGAEPADLIVLSVDPGRADSVTALTRLKTDYPDVVRLVFGAPATREDVLRIAPLCHQYLSKPLDAARLRDTVDRALVVCDLLRQRELRALVGAVGALPSPPSVLIDLRAALEERGTDAARVAGVVKRDPALVAKLLQLANSAFFGTSRRFASGTIVSVEDAVVLLGLNTVHELVLVTAIFVALEDRAVGLGFPGSVFRRHARLVAEIASNLMPTRRCAQEAYLAGLLHDVGKLVLASAFADRHLGVTARARRTDRPVWQVELEEYGSTHAEVGAYLLACWGLPRIVVEAVAHHHHPSALGRTQFDAVGAVHVAEALAHELGGTANDPAWPAETLLDGGYLETIGATHRLSGFRAIATDVARRV